MKQRIKDFFLFLKNVLIPQKSNSYLAVFQKTIAVCLWIVLLSVIGSVVIEVLQIKSNWLSFLENIFVGIGCSAFVVVVSAYLQFVSEHTKLYRKHNTALNYFLANVRFEIGAPSETHEFRSWRIEKIRADRREYVDYCLDLIWYDPDKERKFRDLLGKVFRIVYAVDNFCLTEHSLEKLDVSPESFNETVDAAIALAKTNDAPSNDLFEMLKIDLKKPDKEGENAP